MIALFYFRGHPAVSAGTRTRLPPRPESRPTSRHGTARLSTAIVAGMRSKNADGFSKFESRTK